MASKTASCMNLRLLVSKKSGKILYGEAGKDFVDLLFTFLTLPAGSVMKLFSALRRAKRVGCVTNIYNSVIKLQTVFMNADKSLLLEPKVMSPQANNILRIQSAPIQSTPTVYYVCPAYRQEYSDDTHNVTTKSGDCCSCGETMDYEVKLKKPSNGDNAKGAAGSSGEGYVKETVTFIITDDLDISPSSTITSLNLLNKLSIKDLADLAERNASVGPDEALELLWASLVSTTPLNDVFGVAVSARK